MTILPAIDLKDGVCVRLRQGRASDVTRYGKDPVAQARDWREQGGEELHVVDLDGAFDGVPRHAPVIAQIIEAFQGPVEVGGGLRSLASIEAVVAAGASRVILGSAALEDKNLLTDALKRFGARVAVGIDARDGLVQTRGWVTTSTVKALDLAREVVALGVGTIIYTDTATDGMLSGPNVEQLARLCDEVPSCSITASGGVSSRADVERLESLNKENLRAAIVGKALYDGRVTLAELKGACSHA